MSFRITGLPAERFAHLFALSDPELAALVFRFRRSYHFAASAFTNVGNKEH